jgi:hypothetical protein
VLADWAAAISSFPTDYPRLTGWFSSVVSAGVLLTALWGHWKRPIIKVELGGARSHGRVPLVDAEGKTIETQAKYFRLRITNAGLTTIKDCSGQLLKLTRQIAGKEPECFDRDTYVFGWAHNGESNKRDISRRRSFSMDLATLSLSSGQRGRSQLFFGGLGRPMPTTLAAFLNSYSGKATFRYDLLISADNARPRTVSVEFEFDPERDSLKFIPFNTRYFGWQMLWWLRSLQSRRRRKTLADALPARKRARF